MNVQNKFCEITVSGYDLDGVTPILGEKTYPAFTCGHCSNVVVMNPGRERPRVFCHRCAHYICEKTDLCGTHCTPLPALALDHFETKGDAGLYVRAIMAGVTSIEEAHQKGLVGDI